MQGPQGEPGPPGQQGNPGPQVSLSHYSSLKVMAKMVVFFTRKLTVSKFCEVLNMLKMLILEYFSFFHLIFNLSKLAKDPFPKEKFRRVLNRITLQSACK